MSEVQNVNPRSKVVEAVADLRRSEPVKPTHLEIHDEGLLRDGRSYSRSMEKFWVENGWYDEMYDPKTRDVVFMLKHGDWKDPEARRRAIRFLAEAVLQIGPRYLTRAHFRENMLEGLLARYYHNSPYAAVSDAYPELKLKPSDMRYKPHSG